MMLGAQEVSQGCAALEEMGRDSNLAEAHLHWKSVITAL